MNKELLPNITVIDNDPTKYQVQLLPIEEVWADANFNCRGEIAPIEVKELAADIAARGLDQPIVVMPFTDPARPKIKFRVVAGHRRLLAFRVNQSTNPEVMHIPSYVRPDLSEMQARLLNVRENIHRQELNIKQEARALSYFTTYKKEGTSRLLFTEEELADIFGQSRGWVQIRKALLELPEDIQNEAAAGILTQDQIRVVARIKNKTDQYDMVKKIKLKREKGEKVHLKPSVTRSSDVLKARERKKNEIEELLDLIYEVIGPGLHTRLLAWAAGNISTAAVYANLEEYCKENDIVFKMPDFINNALVGVKGNTPPGAFMKTDPILTRIDLAITRFEVAISRMPIDQQNDKNVDYAQRMAIITGLLKYKDSFNQLVKQLDALGV